MRHLKAGYSPGHRQPFGRGHAGRAHDPVHCAVHDGGASAESAISGFSRWLNRIEAQKRLSLTYDQSREMAEHPQLMAATVVKVYVADPHSPWQIGINESTTGLLRHYLPKGSDLNVFTQTEHPTPLVAGIQMSRRAVYPGRF